MIKQFIWNWKKKDERYFDIERIKRTLQIERYSSLLLQFIYHVHKCMYIILFIHTLRSLNEK